MTVSAHTSLILATTIPVIIAVIVLAVAMVFLLNTPSTASEYSYLCKDDSECDNGGYCDIYDNTCNCTASWSGPQCTIYAPVESKENNATYCSMLAVPCVTDTDCKMCTGTTGTEYTCQELEPDENDFEEEGLFCLPAKPDNACAAAPCDPITQLNLTCNTMPGQFYWTGWQDVNTMQWNCDCEYPNMYPQNSITGACEKSPELCMYGDWQYPCVPDPNADTPGTCLAPSVTQMGADPFVNGMCTCAAATCTTSSDCVSNCLLCNGRSCATDNDCLTWCEAGATCDATSLTCKGATKTNAVGECVAQKTGLNSNGTPTCIADKCYISCKQQQCSTTADCDGACADNTYTCVNNVCSGDDLPLDKQGEWVTDPTISPPNVFGFCACPNGYLATSDSCVKSL